MIKKKGLGTGDILVRRKERQKTYFIMSKLDVTVN